MPSAINPDLGYSPTPATAKFTPSCFFHHSHLACLVDWHGFNLVNIHQNSQVNVALATRLTAILTFCWRRHVLKTAREVQDQHIVSEVAWFGRKSFLALRADNRAATLRPRPRTSSGSPNRHNYLAKEASASSSEFITVHIDYCSYEFVEAVGVARRLF